MKWGDVVLGTSVFVEGYYGKAFFFGDPSKAVTGITPALSRFCSPTDCTVRSEIWKLWSSVSLNLGKNCSIQRYSQAPLFRRTLWAQEGGGTPRRWRDPNGHDDVATGSAMYAYGSNAWPRASWFSTYDTWNANAWASRYAYAQHATSRYAYLTRATYRTMWDEYATAYGECQHWTHATLWWL